jgi:hypothetical protein
LTTIGAAVHYIASMRPTRGLFALVLLLAACGASPATPDAAVGDGRPVDGAVVHVDDGTPVRKPCSKVFGTALSASYGRLDGTLVAIVPPGGGGGCNADADHVHLQVQANGAVYDVAVNVNPITAGDQVHTTTRDLPLPGGLPWTEGWHTGVANDYTAFGVHAADLAATSKAQLTTDLMNELATVNHITIFATGYGPDGVHLVHRNGNGRDGLVITQPLSTPAHARLFSFTTQNF